MRALIASTLTLAFALGGCFDKEEPTCEYWSTKLTSASRAEKALGMVEELKCTDAIPTLVQLFDEGQFRERIIRMLKQIGDKDAATPLLKKALKARDTGKLAATIVGDWQLAAAKPELVEILEARTLPKHREEALKALLKLEKPEAIEDLLIKLATDDMNLQGREVNKIAVDKLGEIGSKKAIPALVKAAFMRSNRGDKVYLAARMALSKIGPESVPVIIETIKGENSDLMKYAKENGIHDFEITSGPEIVQLLTDTLDGRIGKAAIANMAMEIKEPLGVSDAALDMWRTAQMNRLTTIMLGMGHSKIGNEYNIWALKKLIQDPLADAVNQRLKGASVLAYIGSPAAQEAILTIYEEETDNRFRSPLIYPVVEAIDHERLEKFNELVKDPHKLVEATLKDERVVGYLKVVKECKGDEGCLIKKLASEDKWEVVKAALLLARGVKDTDKAIEALAKRFTEAKKSDIDIRRFTLMAMTRLGNKGTGERLLQMAESVEPGDTYWQNELTAYGNYLVHHGEGGPPAAPPEARPAPTPEELEEMEKKKKRRR